MGLTIPVIHAKELENPRITLAYSGAISRAFTLKTIWLVNILYSFKYLSYGNPAPQKPPAPTPIIMRTTLQTGSRRKPASAMHIVCMIKAPHTYILRTY